jgi:hypothetical protein
VLTPRAAPPPGEALADLFGEAKLTAGKGARPGDRVARTAVVWSLGLEYRQHSFGAVRRDDPTVGRAQCLLRTHPPSLPELTIGSTNRPATVSTIHMAATKVLRPSAE